MLKFECVMAAEMPTTLNTPTTGTDLGEVISAFYAEFLAMFGDADLASVATAEVVNELLAQKEASGET